MSVQAGAHNDGCQQAEFEHPNSKAFEASAEHALNLGSPASVQERVQTRTVKPADAGAIPVVTVITEAIVVVKVSLSRVMHNDTSSQRPLPLKKARHRGGAGGLEEAPDAPRARAAGLAWWRG